MMDIHRGHSVPSSELQMTPDFWEPGTGALLSVETWPRLHRQLGCVLLLYLLLKLVMQCYISISMYATRPRSFAECR